jgi:hypothetical protein
VRLEGLGQLKNPMTSRFEPGTFRPVAYYQLRYSVPSIIKKAKKVKKVKLSLCLTNLALRHEGVCGSGCTDPHYLDLGTSWRRVVSFTLLPLYSRERAPGTYGIGGWVGPTAGLDDLEKRKFLTLPGLELRPLGHPARGQSLYRLRHPGSPQYFIMVHS